MRSTIIDYRVPSPYLSMDFHASMEAAASTAAYAAAAWPAANRAHYVPIWFPASVVITELRVGFTTAAGNYDLGLYDSNYSLIEAKGSTACSNAAHVFTLTKPQRVRGGDVFYGSLVLSSTSDSAFRAAPAGVSGVHLGLALENLGATALPSTATPAAPTEPAYLPLIMYGLQ